MYRNRIREYRTVASSDLLRNPLNFRRHPDAQKAALRSLLTSVGRVAPLLAYEHDGALTLLDGHARLDESDTWDVAILDIDDHEAATVLAMLDKIGAGAEIDADALLALLDALPTEARQTAGAAWSDDELAAIIGSAQQPQAPDSVPTEDIPDDDGVEVDDLLAPFPWFGGKARVAGRVWARFGPVECYVEPFCGSAAVLLACPFDIPTRTVNDADGFIANFWRAVAADPEQVAHSADWPVNENDLFARHIWLVRQNGDLVRALETDPDYFDAKIAGWWVWGCCAWIGGGWCSGEGPWSTEGDQVVNIRGGDAGQGVNRKLPHLGDAGRGVNRQLPHLGNAGQGVNRQLPHLGDAGRGVNRQLPHLGDAGRGVNRKLPHLGTAGQGVNRQLPHLGDGRGISSQFASGDRRDCASITAHLHGYIQRLSDKLRRVRVTCGDWARVTTESVTTRHGLTAVLLDPPYGEGAMEYTGAGNADNQIARDVWAWACANGDNPLFRIGVCGYEDNRDVPPGWTAMRWKARKGYAATEEAVANSAREVVWFSPHCVTPDASA